VCVCVFVWWIFLRWGLTNYLLKAGFEQSSLWSLPPE
jgi:hypothetical protein